MDYPIPEEEGIYIYSGPSEVPYQANLSKPAKPATNSDKNKNKSKAVNSNSLQA